MTSLIIINGAPATGKSSVGSLLRTMLKGSAFLDGDDVWRINPFEVNERTTALATGNITSVLRNYIAAGYDYVILAWVLHRQTIIDELLTQLNDLPKTVHVFTLVADEQVITNRISNDSGRPRDPERALLRLRQTLQLNTHRIDTTLLSPQEVAGVVLGVLRQV